MLFLLYHFVVVRMALERRDVIAENMRLRSEKDGLLEQQALEVARTRQANQDKSAFLAAASHDLRQPVHALMLLSHALRRRVAEPESVVLVERILEAGTALADQFNNLMDLSRLEGGAYKLNGVRFALDEFLLKAAASHRQVAESRGLSLRLRMDRRLRKPACTRTPACWCGCWTTCWPTPSNFPVRAARCCSAPGCRATLWCWACTITAAAFRPTSNSIFSSRMFNWTIPPATARGVSVWA